MSGIHSIKPPPQHRLRSLEDLSILSPDDWRDWLRFGTESWTRAAGSADRVDAFAPVVLNPREPGPHQLARSLRRLGLPPSAARDLEDALAGELAIWSFTDSIDRGCFLLELAAWFGCRRIVTALRSLLARPNHAGPEGRQRLAIALGFAVTRRTAPEEALALGRRMRDCGLAPQAVVAQIVAYAATAAPVELPALLDEFLPDWDVDGLTTDFAQFLANQIVDRVGITEVALLVTGDDRESVKTLSALLQANRLDFRFDQGNYVVDLVHKRSVRLPDAISSNRVRRAPEDHALTLFQRNSLGEFGISDVELEMLPPAGNA